MREPQSVLLKRGPVLVSGEDERELIMLTNGFVLARVEMDALVDLLLDSSTRGGGDDNDDNEDVGEAEALAAEKKLRERFNAIDTDHSGCKYAVFHYCSVCQRCSSSKSNSHTSFYYFIHQLL